MFQSVTVLRKNKAFNLILLSLAAWNLEPTGVADSVSGDGVVRVATLEAEDGWVDFSAGSVCWRQGVSWRHGWDVALNNLMESCQPLFPPSLLQWWLLQLQEHASYASHLSRPVLPLGNMGCMALHPLQSVHILPHVWVQYCCSIFQQGPDPRDVCQMMTLLGAAL